MPSSRCSILKELGFDLPIRTTVSNNAYRDLNLGTDFERLAWKGIVAVDYLQKLLWRTRPYEKDPGPPTPSSTSTPPTSLTASSTGRTSTTCCGRPPTKFKAS